MFQYDARFNGPRSEGVLRWDDDRYDASSGPAGAGTILVGAYDVKIDEIVENTESEFCGKDDDGKICFFISLEPRTQINRDGFGIRPEGRTPDSFGCLVMPAATARHFWSKWKRTSKAKLPLRLEVKNTLATLRNGRRAKR
jgi:hypothetical protein